jgi:hypothetical protein
MFLCRSLLRDQIHRSRMKIAIFHHPSFRTGGIIEVPIG